MKKVSGREKSRTDRLWFAFAMSTRVFLIVIVTLTSWFVNMSWTDVTWKRDRKFDDVVKVTGYPYTEVAGKPLNVRRCAALCTANSSCSSFFFLQTTGRCLLNEFVFAKPDGGQRLPGARYFTAAVADCPARDGYTWLRGQRTCIKVYLSAIDIYYAYGNCTSVGSRLVVLDTGGKNRAVAAYMMDGYAKISAYIGGARNGALNRTRSRWDSVLDPMYWLNGKKVATSGVDSSWGNGNPSNDGGNEGCMECYGGQWNDLPCSAQRAFICEKMIT